MTIASTEPMRESARFKALLNPLRDITASWGVDVSKELCDYASTIGIEFAGAEPLLTSEAMEPPSELVDFAEAALIVQGSTSIYSRKVEHLYSLVFSAVSTLNQLSAPKKAAGRAAANANDEPDDPDEEFNIDNFNFLSLDDYIDKADDHQISQPKSVLPPPGSLLDKTCLRPVPPMLVQNACPVDASNLERAHFKIRTAITHPSGALIAEGCPPFDENLDALCKPRVSAYALQSAKEEGDAHSVDHNTDFGSCGDDDITSVAPPPFEEESMLHPFPSQTAESFDVVLPSQQRASRQLAPRQARVEKDLFEMLDPHLQQLRHNRPPKKGRTYRKPRAVSRSGASLLMPDIWAGEEFSLVSAIIGEVPRQASFSNYVCTEAARKPLKDMVRKRNAHKRALLHVDDDGDSDCDVQMARSAGDGLHAPGEGDLEDGIQLFGDDGDLLGFDGGGMDDNDDDMMNGNEECPMPSTLQSDESGLFGVENGTDGLKLVKETRLGGDLETLASSYALTCQKYLQMTSWMWEQRVVDTKLAKRVEDWTTRIHPVLEKEERRREFDIHKYGENILSRYRQPGQNESDTMNMSKLLRASEKFDVCRLFLSSLQLANQGCIEIEPDENQDTCEVSDPSVRLLAADGEEVFATPLARKKRKRIGGATPLSQKRQPARLRIENVCT